MKASAFNSRQAWLVGLIFPYADGAFRDTFTRTADAWTLLIESQAADGSWNTFASYERARVK
ncbi:MAG: hypothetical protein ACRET4_01780 [Steroidobacteraceae bacterium]